MKEVYITLTGFYNYYGFKPFAIGRRIRCVKEPHNPFDTEAIRAEMKYIGTVGYVANSINTVAMGTSSAGAVGHLVNNTFTVEVKFMTSTKIICKVVDGLKRREYVPPKSCEDDVISF